MKRLRLSCLLWMLGTLAIVSTFANSCVKSINNQATATSNDFITQSDFLLNTVVTISLYDKRDQRLLTECFDKIKQYEKIFSRTDEASELYQINQSNVQRTASSLSKLTYRISDPMSELLTYGLYYSNRSEGFFDITIAPLTCIWDFNSATPVLPEEGKITSALSLINYKNVTLKGNRLTFAKQGIAIDLGAIAKGYIADRIKEFLILRGVKSAIINLGGNILCIGKKPDHTPFHVGIQKPFADRNETLAVMDIEDYSVVSSGIYERFFILNGVTYHHILNPRTGYPYQNGLVSVTIISEKSVDGDGLSTTCFALGLEAGLKLIESLPNTYAVFITEDYELYYSKGFQDAINVRY